MIRGIALGWANIQVVTSSHLIVTTERRPRTRNPGRAASREPVFVDRIGRIVPWPDQANPPARRWRVAPPARSLVAAARTSRADHFPSVTRRRVRAGWLLPAALSLVGWVLRRSRHGRQAMSSFWGLRLLIRPRPGIGAAPTRVNHRLRRRACPTVPLAEDPWRPLESPDRRPRPPRAFRSRSTAPRPHALRSDRFSV